MNTGHYIHIDTTLWLRCGTSANYYREAILETQGRTKPPARL